MMLRLMHADVDDDDDDDDSMGHFHDDLLGNESERALSWSCYWMI